MVTPKTRVFYNFLEHARDRRVCLCPRSTGIEDIWDTNHDADDGDATDVHDEHTPDDDDAVDAGDDAPGNDHVHVQHHDDEDGVRRCSEMLIQVVQQIGGTNAKI